MRTVMLRQHQHQKWIMIWTWRCNASLAVMWSNIRQYSRRHPESEWYWIWFPYSLTLFTYIINFCRILFIIWDKSIRVYSTITGEWIRDLEGPDNKIIGHQCDALNPKLLYACTDAGEIVSWKWKSGVINNRVKLNFVHSHVTVGNFSLLEMKDKRSYALITWRHSGVSKVKMGVFDLIDGTLQEVTIPLDLGYVYSNRKWGRYHSSNYSTILARAKFR